jgi:hypothetical protein
MSVILTTILEIVQNFGYEVNEDVEWAFFALGVSALAA